MFNLTKKRLQLPDRNFVESGIQGAHTKVLMYAHTKGIENGIQIAIKCNLRKITGRCISAIFCLFQVVNYAGKTLCVVEEVIYNAVK